MAGRTTITRATARMQRQTRLAATCTKISVRKCYTDQTAIFHFNVPAGTLSRLDNGKRWWRELNVNYFGALICLIKTINTYIYIERETYPKKRYNRRCKNAFAAAAGAASVDSSEAAF